MSGYRLAWVVALAAVLVGGGVSGGQTTRGVNDVRARLREIRATPRFFLTAEAQERVRANIAADGDMRGLGEYIKAAAEKVLDEPVVEHKLTGRRLLGPAREGVARVTHLAMAYRLTGEKKYAERGIREMAALAAFPDLNPSHYLDTAESTTALAIGLDSFDDVIDAATRLAVKRAIIDKGIKPSFASNQWWVKGENNWNQVCNGGLTLGALAVADVDEELAARTIARAVEGVPYAMVHYGPDGAYPEGPGYWGYGTSYNVLMISALETALGTDFGLSGQAGFMGTADYFLHATGPTGLFFNYSDSGQRGVNAPAGPMFYFAGKRDEPGLLLQERGYLHGLVSGDLGKARARDRFLPYLLVWARPGATGVGAGKLPGTHYVGQGDTPVAFHRSGWTGDATYVAIKGGAAETNHAHMDAGTFVLDMQGVRWADDLGMQDYESLESRKVDLWNKKQDSQRWQVFRLSAGAHNVLTVDGRPHAVAGKAGIVLSREDRTVVDLSPVYAGQLASAGRGVWLRGDGSVLLQDEVKGLAEKGGTVRWAMVTRAEVECRGNEVVLKRGGKTVRMVVSGLGDVVCREYSTKGPNDFDAANPGTRMVGFEVKVGAGEAARWRVEFWPGGVAGQGGEVPGLGEW